MGSSVIGADGGTGMATAVRGFDPQDLQPAPGLASIRAAVIGWLVKHPLWILAALRRFRPVLLAGQWAVITRYDDVVTALDAPEAIAVPFAAAVEALNDGPNFLLGMADGADYRWLRGIVLAAFPPSEAGTRVQQIATDEAQAIVAAANGRLDAVRDLITRVPTRICERYYGVPVADEVRFGQITIAMSSFMFGGPATPKLRTAALAAGAELRAIVDAAIVAAHASPTADTVVARLVRAQASEPRLTDPIIRSCLIGMITGFVPTNTMAAGHMLDVLLDRPGAMTAARAAAVAGDDDRLCRCLFEAMRFFPLNPGMFRVAAEDFTFASGGSVRKGMQVLVSTQSAMFDPRRIAHANTYDPDRPASDFLLFGHGMHWCIGAALARAQITHTLKPLLLRDNLRRAPGRAGRLGKLGPFPADLTVVFD